MGCRFTSTYPYCHAAIRRVEETKVYISHSSLSYSPLSLTHSLTQSVTHSLTQSVSQSLTHSVSHSLSQSLTHSLTQSLTQSVTHSLSQSVTHSLSQSVSHSLTQSVSQSVTHSLTQSVSQSVSHSLHLESLTMSDVCVGPFEFISQVRVQVDQLSRCDTSKKTSAPK